MPELPEVETVRRGLERLVVSRTISSVEVKVPKMIKTSYDSFLNDLPGQTIQAMRRRGKYLIFDYDFPLAHGREIPLVYGSGPC